MYTETIIICGFSSKTRKTFTKGFMKQTIKQIKTKCPYKIGYINALQRVRLYMA